MAQSQIISHPLERYTRADYTALRAYMHKIPSRTILDLYYSEDDQIKLGLETGSHLLERLYVMRDTLVERAVDMNPYLATTLRHARDKGFWSKNAINALVNAADEKMFAPEPSHFLSAWFRARVHERLAAEGCKTINDLANLINCRGTGWYLPIPRIGAKVARAIERWFEKHKEVSDLIDWKRLIPAEPLGDLVLIDMFSTLPVPLDKLKLSTDLDGHNGINRSRNVCMISARHDLDAVRAYLKKYEVLAYNDKTKCYVHTSKTHRSYQKEIERFLLWCVMEKKKPMSSILGDDCEDYKRFLAYPPAHWTGPREIRGTSKWRPFTGAMSPASQLYAVRILRYFFTYLVDVCYLNGNPWRAVSDPVTVKEELPMQIEKALSSDLWHKLAATDGILDWYCGMTDAELKTHFIPYGIYGASSMLPQMRLVRAAILLLGEVGLRRAEAATATRESLSPIQGNDSLWELKVVGKGKKKRTVLVPARVVEAIRAHWTDRPDADFGFRMAALPLLSPVTFPQVRHARDKHLVDPEDTTSNRLEQPFTSDSLGRLVSKSLSRIANDTANPYLKPDERASLLQAAAHALRHTFGTNSVNDEVPLDVIQNTLGHASLQTTTIYVQAERKRMIEEYSRREARRVKRANLTAEDNP